MSAAASAARGWPLPLGGCRVPGDPPRPQARFVGPTFAAAARDDLARMARGTSGTVTAHWGGHGVLLRDPVHVVYGIPEFPALPERPPLQLNFGTEPARANATQRQAQRPAEIQRLGHVVLGTTRFRAALDWYLDTLGLIVSDFLYLDGQQDRGPAMAFIRRDLGGVPADHHTLAMVLQPRTGYVHSAYQLTDLDEVAASGEYLRERGYRHVRGLGRHIQGSQIFDYWRDLDRVMFEHYADGDVFDCAMEPGWAPLSVSCLAQPEPGGDDVREQVRGPAAPVKAQHRLGALAAHRPQVREQVFDMGGKRRAGGRMRGILMLSKCCG